MSPKKVKPIQPSKKEAKSEKQPKTNSTSDKTSKVLGAIFVITGLTLIFLLILYYFISRLPYRKDPNMPIPTLNEIEEVTNDETITITGDVIPGEKVALYMDGKEENEYITADDSGKFEFRDVELEHEGETKFEAATIRGSIFKKRSEKSNTIATEIDWTAPSGKVELDYDEISTIGTTKVEGHAEKNSYVILRSDDTEYETKTDNEGDFIFENIKLEEGKNTYKTSVRDEAGNEVLSSSKVEITKETGDINGPGAAISYRQDSTKLPESAGELEKALEIIRGNDIMFIIGLISILAFGVSSTGVYLYNRRTA